MSPPSYAYTWCGATLLLLAPVMWCTVAYAQTTPSPAQVQLRQSAHQAMEAGDPNTSIELLQGYLQLGASQVGWLEMARARLMLGQCQEAQDAVAQSKTAPNSAELSQEELKALERELGHQLILKCEADAEASQLYTLGQDLFTKRRWAEAANAFSKAFEKDPVPALGYNTGRSYEYAGDLESAKTWYARSLTLAPDKALRTKLESTLERLQNIQKNLSPETQTGLLEVNSLPQGALVKIDGKVIGQTPLQTAYPPGSWSLEIEKSDFQAVTRTLVLKPGREIVLETKLERENRFWTWVSLSGGAALLGTGAGLGILAQDKLDEATSTAALRDPALLNSLQDDGKLLANLSLVSYILGGVAVAGSAVLYVLETPEEVQEQETLGQQGHWQVGFGPQGWNVGWRGRW